MRRLQSVPNEWREPIRTVYRNGWLSPTEIATTFALPVERVRYICRDGRVPSADIEGMTCSHCGRVIRTIRFPGAWGLVCSACLVTAHALAAYFATQPHTDFDAHQRCVASLHGMFRDLGRGAA